MHPISYKKNKKKVDMGHGCRPTHVDIGLGVNVDADTGVHMNLHVDVDKDVGVNKDVNVYNYGCRNEYQCGM